VRGFFLLLLLTNLGFIAWQYSQGEGQSSVVDIYHGINIVNEGLTLISELPPERQPALLEGADDGEMAKQQMLREEAQTTAMEQHAIVEVTSQDKADVVGVTCLHMAGIHERQELERIIKVLRDNGATAIEQGETRVTRTNYRVLLPPYPSLAKAAEAAAILDARQVKDFFIVRSGDNENAVSLGVFSTRERAERRYQQIVDLKERLRKPEIEAIDLPGIEFTVSYNVAGQSARQKLEISLKELKAPPSEELSCK
jgi:hypothetical protein